MAMRPQIKRAIERWRRDAARGGQYRDLACREADRYEYSHFEDDERVLQGLGITKIRLRAEKVHGICRFTDKFC